LMGRSFCSRKSAVLAVRYESGFRERDRQGQHWRGMRSHGGFSKMIVCESQGYASGLAYDFFQILRRPTTSRLLRIYIYIRIYLKNEVLAGHRPGRCSAVDCLRKMASLQWVGGPTGAARSRRRGHGRAGKRSDPLWRGQISPASKQGQVGVVFPPACPCGQSGKYGCGKSRNRQGFWSPGRRKRQADRKGGKIEARRGRDSARGSMRSTRARSMRSSEPPGFHCN
jgi:hypothetical protein